MQIDHIVGYCDTADKPLSHVGDGPPAGNNELCFYKKGEIYCVVLLFATSNIAECCDLGAF